MFMPIEKTKTEEVMEMMGQAESLLGDLRFAYLEMSRRYDEALEKMDGLVADKIYLEDVLAGREDY